MKKCKQGYYYCNTSKKCKKIPKGHHVMPSGYLMRDSEHEEEGKKNGNGNHSNGNGNGNGSSSNGGGNGGSVSEAAVSKKQQRFFGMVRAVQKG